MVEFTLGIYLEAVLVGGVAGRTKGGIYYKGSLLSVRAPPPAGAALQEHARFDPWESIVVEWDAAGRDEEFIQVPRNRRAPWTNSCWSSSA